MKGINMSHHKPPHTENRIIKILPWYGEYHAYFQLYLYSIYKNKDCLDLLLVSEKPPEYPLPSNVIFLQKSLQEIDQLLVKTIYETYDICLNSSLPTHLENRHNPAWKLCDYRALYPLLFFNNIKEYSHWAFGDCDTIFGNINKSISDLFSYELIVGKGHFSVFKNEKIWNSGFVKPEFWVAPGVRDYGTNRFNAAVQKIKDIIKYNGFDESYFIPDAKIYAEYHPEKLKLLDLQSSGKYCHNHLTETYKPDGGFKLMYCGEHPHPEAFDNYYLYADGVLYRCSDAFDIKKPCLYSHFMGRTKLAKNSVKIENYDAPLQFSVRAPLIFS